MSAFTQSQEIRERANIKQRRKGYFLQKELEQIAKFLKISKKELIDLDLWTDKKRFRNGSVNAEDMRLLLSLVKNQTKPRPTQVQLVPPSSYGTQHTETFGVVDAGLTSNETTLNSIYNMLPKAMTEEATYLSIRKETENHRDINGELRVLTTDRWIVQVTFERK